MRDYPNKDTAVIIPARNEEKRIAACLTALAGQLPDRATIIVVVNNTTDDTKKVARRIAFERGIDVRIVDCILSPEMGVGAARRIGCTYALRRMPQLQYMLTTDADCLAAPDWVPCNIEHLQYADIVCGKIDLIADEADILCRMDQALATNEGTYRTLVQTVYARHSDQSPGLDLTHGEAAGASLSIRKTSYLAVGGFRNMRCGEDREIVRAHRSAGYRVIHADDVIVEASCRLAGRAAGGMSDALKARISGNDYLIDDCLPDAAWLIKNAATRTLGVWPPQVPPSRRVHVRDLPLNIQMLRRFLSSKQIVVAGFGSSSQKALRQADEPQSGNRVSAGFADPSRRDCIATGPTSEEATPNYQQP